MNGEIFFDMITDDKPSYGLSKYLIKIWKRHTIYYKSGSYNKGNNPREGLFPSTDGWKTFTDTSENIATNLYQTGSIYLYNYAIISAKWFYDMVYTEPVANTIPSYEGKYPPGYKWEHNINTFKNSPNSIMNNYVLTSSAYIGGFINQFIYNKYINVDDGTYFELVNGYPRNHFTHKRDLFSLYNIISTETTNNQVIYTSYRRNRQTTNSTIGLDGLADGSFPVQSLEVGNLNLLQTDNVINH